MGKEYRAKVFKSGNSAALRLPKALGFAEGDEIVLVPHEDGSFSFWKQDDAKQAFLNLFGAMSPDFMASGRGDTEQEERDWEAGDKRSAVA